MSLNWADGVVHGTYISFVVDYEHQKTEPITDRWYVLSAERERIGIVKWFGRFRGYSYFPEPGSVYEKVCMREIAEFTDELDKVHRRLRKAKKEMEQAQAVIRLLKAKKAVA